MRTYLPDEPERAGHVDALVVFKDNGAIYVQNGLHQLQLARVHLKS